MMESEVRLEITHFPNGEEVPESGNYILHLMPDGSVIGCPLGPTVITDGKFIRIGAVRFEWYDDRPDIHGIMVISPTCFTVSTGCGYSGSSYEQSFPEYKWEAVTKWISKFRPNNP